MSTSFSPGVNLEQIFKESDPQHLMEFIEGKDLELLSKLGIEKHEQLAAFASSLVKPKAMQILENGGKRKLFLQMLSTAKRDELAERLGTKTSSIDALAEESKDPACLRDFQRFIGIDHEEYVPFSVAPLVGAARASYGLYQHQRKAVHDVKHILRSDTHRAVLHMPTGSGKTRTAMHLIADHLRSQEPSLVCWLAQNIEILEQAANEFEQAWCQLGNREVCVVRFWGSSAPDPCSVKDGIVVAGLGKMHAFRRNNLDEFLKLSDLVSLIIVDEAHQSVAPTYERVISSLQVKRPDTLLLGLTATPGRSWSNRDDDRLLSEFFDNNKVMLKVEGYSNPIQYLIEEGYLAKFAISTLNSNARCGGKDVNQSEDYSSDLLEGLGSDVERNALIIEKIKDISSRHKRIIVFSASVDNAYLLSAIMNALGYNANAVSSRTPAHERTRIVNKFSSNSDKAMILFNYGVLTTGFDVPRISAALIARPTRSLVLYSQMMGRAMRGPKAGGITNGHAEIVTVVDPDLPGFGDMAEAFTNWEDVWNEQP